MPISQNEKLIDLDTSDIKSVKDEPTENISNSTSNETKEKVFNFQNFFI
jgi:hypothetical protein